MVHINSAVYLEWQGPTARVIMNRPDVLNAQDWRFVNDLHAALDELERVHRVEAVIVSGQGRAFSTGIDLTALAGRHLQIDWFRCFDEALRRLERLPALTVAKMHGYALGGGLMVSLACDLRISATGTRFGFPAVTEALVPGMGTYRLPRFVGLGRAKRLVLTGEFVDGETALQMGLIDWLVPEHEFDDRTDRIVQDTLRSSATARCRARDLVLASFESSFDDAMERYLDCQQQCLVSPEHARAMEDYLVRRKS